MSSLEGLWLPHEPSSDHNTGLILNASRELQNRASPEASTALKPAQTRPQRFLNHLSQQVAPDLLFEIELMILAVASGITDAYIYTDYRTFVSNQTGNTALLAVGTLDLAPDAVNFENLGLSLGMFCLGGLCFGQLGHWFGRTRRSWLLTTNVLQSAMVFTAAGLRKWVAPTRAHPLRHTVISLVAFAWGGQVAMARTSHVPDVTTAMISVAYIDLFTDDHLTARKNRPRNRRFIFIVSLLTGGFAGAAGYRKVGPAFALLLAALAKSIVCILMMFNRKNE